MDVWVVFGFSTVEPGPSGACFARVLVGGESVISPQILAVSDDETYAKKLQNAICNIAKEKYGRDIVVGLQKVRADMFHHLLTV